jgi:hypothetical protein
LEGVGIASDAHTQDELTAWRLISSTPLHRGILAKISSRMACWFDAGQDPGRDGPAEVGGGHVPLCNGSCQPLIFFVFGLNPLGVGLWTEVDYLEADALIGRSQRH